MANETKTGADTPTVHTENVETQATKPAEPKMTVSERLRAKAALAEQKEKEAKEAKEKANAEKEKTKAEEKAKKEKEKAEAKEKKEKERAEAKAKKEAEKKANEFIPVFDVIETSAKPAVTALAKATTVDITTLEAYEQTATQSLLQLSEVISRVDAKGNPFVPNDKLLAMLNMQEVDAKLNFIRRGMFGRELKRRVLAKQQEAGLEGGRGSKLDVDTQYLATIKMLTNNGDIKCSAQTLYEDTRIVEQFDQFLIGKHVEEILPRNHWKAMATQVRDSEPKIVEDLINHALTGNNGVPMNLEQFKTYLQLDTPKVGDNSKAPVVEKDAKIKIIFSIEGFADFLKQAELEYGTLEMFVKDMLVKEYGLQKKPKVNDPVGEEFFDAKDDVIDIEPTPEELEEIEEVEIEEVDIEDPEEIDIDEDDDLFE